MTIYFPKDVLSEQAPMDHGAMNNEDQCNDHIEEDDHTDNIVEDDSTNTLIHDTFNVRMDDDDDDHEMMTLMMFMIYLFLGSHTNPFMKAPTQIFSLLHC